MNHPANLVTSEVFRTAFGAGSGSQFFEEYIDEDRLGASDESLEESLGKKYGNIKMDLVIGGDSIGAKVRVLVQKHGLSLEY